MTGLAYRFLKWDASDNAPIIPIATGEDAEVDERDAGKLVLFVSVVAYGNDRSVKRGCILMGGQRKGWGHG